MMFRSVTSKILSLHIGSMRTPVTNGTNAGLTKMSTPKGPIFSAKQYSSLTSLHQYHINVDRITHQMSSMDLKSGKFTLDNHLTPAIFNTPVRLFHARHSKVRYLDFRYRLPTGHLRKHLLIIRRQKMKKHQRRKWRRKFKCVLAKKRLKREIAKEKTFRVELLTMIRRAEQFDPREYALRKIHEEIDKPYEKTKEEKLEDLKELIRVNRYQTDFIKPEHKKVQSFDLIQPAYQEFAASH